MKTLQIILLFSLIFLGSWAQNGLSLSQDHSAEKYPLYVNNEAKTEGNGTKDNPFQTLHKALETISVSESFFQKPYSEYDILLVPTASPYLLDEVSITSPKNLSIDIRSSDADNISDAVLMNCSNFAQIGFSNNSASTLIIKSISSFKLSTVSILNPLTAYSQLNVN